MPTSIISLTAVLTAPQAVVESDEKSYDLALNLDHTVGVSRLLTGAEDDIAVQSWSAHWRYTFAELPVPLSVGVRGGLAVKVDGPRVFGTRNIDHNIRLMVFSNDLFHDDVLTGIVLRAGVEGDLAFDDRTPMSIFTSADESPGTIAAILDDRSEYKLRGWVGVARSFGEYLDLEYRFSATKPFSVWEEPLYRLHTHILGHSVAVVWHAFTWLKLSYSLGIVTFFPTVPHADLYLSPPTVDAIHYFNPTFEVRGVLSEWFASLGLPITATVSLGAQALHETRLVPVVFNTFSSIHGYGSVYLKLAVVY